MVAKMKFCNQQNIKIQHQYASALITEYSVTARSSVLVEKLIVAYLVNKFPSVYTT
jgi:hypothetical protein